MIKKQVCPKGEVWCPIHKKCKPAEHRPGKGKQFGQGDGPMGIPKQEQKIDDLVDEVFEEGFNKLNQLITLEKQVDDTLDKVKDTVKVRVSPTMQGGVDVRITENEVLDILQNLKEDKNYKAYFKSQLQKSGYKSINAMPDDAKKKFFNSVDKGWKATNESKEELEEGVVKDVYGAVKKEREINKNKNMTPNQKKMAWAKHIVILCKSDAKRKGWSPEKLKKCMTNAMAKAKK